jgi:D-alanine-D-alanine ligase
VRIGITYNLRPDESPATPTTGGGGALDLPGNDRHEEFDSPETIAAIAEALESLGHEVELLGYGEPLVARLLSGPRPELVWNLAEGHGAGRCREARVPAVLEMFDVPYTGSDPLTLAATLDKPCAKRLVAAAGVATPEWVEFDGDWPAVKDRLAALPLPVFVKPACDGSSKGIVAGSLIRESRALRPAIEQLHAAYGQTVLIEEFIDGDELTVGVLGHSPPEMLGIMRVAPRDGRGAFVYSLEVKRDFRRQARYECPAALSEQDTRAVEAAALAAYEALGCRDVARLDFRLRRGVPYFLEANPLPGLSPTSGDLVIMAGLLGLDHRQLVVRILKTAMVRLRLATVQTVG